MGSKISCLSKTSMTGRLHYKALETELVDLVEGQALHWRHKEMAVGMLLSMITYDNPPSPRSTALWLDLLLRPRINQVHGIPSIGGDLEAFEGEDQESTAFRFGACIKRRRGQIKTWCS